MVGFGAVRRVERLMSCKELGELRVKWVYWKPFFLLRFLSPLISLSNDV